MNKITFLFLLLPALMLSQKITTKKDKVLVDGKEVAILNDKTRDVYIFSDLAGKKQITATYRGISEGQTIINQWLEVASADGTKTTEIPYDVLITSFSPTRIIAHLLAVKYNLFDGNGFNQSNIDAFFDVQRESISEKSLRAKTDAVANRQEKQEKIGRYRPIVKGDGTVLFGGTSGTTIVGRAVTSPYTAFGSNNTATVFDLDGITVATALLVGGANNDVEVKLYNDIDFKYVAEKRFAGGDNASFLTELIGELVSRDVLLGHQAKKYKAELLKEKTKLAKERSVNVYNVPGYAIDDKGVKYEGVLTAQFEKLDINQTGNTEVVDAIDMYGKSVSVKYQNEKGRDRTITLSAKDNVRFFVKNVDGTQTAYQGMKVKGDAAKKLSNAMSLGFNNAYFYRELFTEKGNQVLVDPVDKDRFVIKLANSDTGQMIDNRSNDKLVIQLSEYLASCASLAKEIKAGAFDLKIEENLINIVREYNDCK